MALSKLRRRFVHAGTDMDSLGAWWSRSPQALAEALGTGVSGLASAEAARRLGKYGANRLKPRERLAAGWLLLRQFRSPLILLLIFAAGVAAVVHDWTDALIVLAIVLGSGLLGFHQEYRASRALDRLHRRVQQSCTAIRDGSESKIPAESVVPGDVVVVRAGSLIPADGVLLEAKDLYVTESALTGESMPVAKLPGLAAAGASLAERRNCLYMGTSVRSGTGRALIVATGRATVFGRIAATLRLRPPETDFERGIRQYGYLLTQFMVVLVVLIFAANVLLDRPAVEALLFAIALAVGISPELLPAIVSVTLATGAREMAEHGVIVRRLDAIENFGSMDVLCSDKTGTLTEGEIGLESARSSAGAEDERVLLLAYLNARFQSGMDNPLDAAIVAHAERKRLDVAQFDKIDEVPYDFVRRRLTIVVRRQGAADCTLVTKGAVASVLDVCSSVRTGGESKPLDDAGRAPLQALFEQWSTDGYRVLGLASGSVAGKGSYGRVDEANLSFDGFLLFMDPPRAGIGRTLGALADSGVRLKIVTGDNRFVSAHLGGAIGLPSMRMLTGADLNELREEALVKLAPQTDFFVEVDPIQKERIVRALKKAGHVVGYLGDGINDASALHAADVGISVANAADVAREAADFVLLEHDLEILERGVRQGRKTFANTLKYISITTSANFGNMISMAVSCLVLPFLPLLAKQILLNNFLSDFPSMAIANDRVDPSMVAKPQRWDFRSVRRFTMVFGLVSTAFDFLTFGVLLFVFSAGPELFRTGWFFVSLLTELAIVLVVRTHGPFYRSRPGRLLLWATFATMLLTFALPYAPFAGELGFVPLSFVEIAVLTLIAALYLAASELAKRWFYRRTADTGRRPSSGATA